MRLRIIDRKTKADLVRAETLHTELLSQEAERCAILRGDDDDASTKKFLEKVALIKARLTTPRATDTVISNVETLIRGQRAEAVRSQGAIDIDKLLDLL